MAGENPRVEYDVKELFERIDHKLDSLVLQLDSKAPLEMVTQVGQRMQAIEMWKASVEHTGTPELVKRVSQMEEALAENKARLTLWRWAVPVFLSALLFALTYLLH